MTTTTAFALNFRFAASRTPFAAPEPPSSLLFAGPGALEPVRTPKTDIPHNFGPSSTNRDQILFTCQCPGTNPKEKRKGVVPKEEVDEWLVFMKSQGITDVLVLMDENELEIYEEPGLLELYKVGGIEPHLTPMGPDGAYDQIMGIIKDIEARNGKAVTHCTGGTGRAGRVAAAWLANRYELSPVEATQEAVDTAIESGVQRLGHAEKLAGWMNK